MFIMVKRINQLEEQLKKVKTFFPFLHFALKKIISLYLNAKYSVLLYKFLSLKSETFQNSTRWAIDARRDASLLVYVKGKFSEPQGWMVQVRFF